ncbi:MAG TPA: sensor histidine kinase [Phototrophicaceae bacterium]|nr:sensor histidine kinase [Phototrophicaceae bacterium]
MMEEMMRFDGVLHWCCLISVFIFAVGLTWVTLRVLLPLRQLAKLAASVNDGSLPAFDTPGSGIREIEQLRLALYEMTARIQAGQAREIGYRNALADSQEQERMRIAREIHDDTIQALVLVGHELERAVQAITAADHPQLADHLTTARGQLIATIDTLRRMITNLRPPMLDELGLISALESLCEDHPQLEFKVSGRTYPLERAQELAIFRTAQEAIRNAERHAQASRISIILAYKPGTVRFEVRDDGVGFPVPPHFQEFATQNHYGLIGVRERILHSGGQLNVTSVDHAGTCIAVTFPQLIHV